MSNPDSDSGSDEDFNVQRVDSPESFKVIKVSDGLVQPDIDTDDQPGCSPFLD